MSEVVAVGDGLSDIRLLKAGGASVAFAADAKTRSEAKVAVSGRDVTELRDIPRALLKRKGMQ